MGGNSVELLRRDIVTIEQIVAVALAAAVGGVLLFRYFKKRKMLAGKPSFR